MSAVTENDEANRDTAMPAGLWERSKLRIARTLDSFRRFASAFCALNYRYESARRLWGVPLLSVNLGFDDNNGRMSHAKGIIAIGTRATGVIAFGVLVARGVLAVGNLAIGVGTVSLASVALLTVSVFGVGVVSVSVFAMGYLAVGIFAFGYKTVGILAIGREVVGVLGIGAHVKTLFHL